MLLFEIIGKCIPLIYQQPLSSVQFSSPDDPCRHQETSRARGKIVLQIVQLAGN